MTYQLDSKLASFQNSVLHPAKHGEQPHEVHSAHQHHASPDAVSVLLLMSTLMDCEFLSNRFSQIGGTRVLESSHDLQQTIQKIGLLRPDVVIFDPKTQLRYVKQLFSLVESRLIGHLILLDDQVREGLLLKALETPRTSYLTRQAGVCAVQSAVVSVAATSGRVFDSQIEKRLVRTPAGYRLTRLPNQESIASLTPRELDVLKLVALGHTVRDCARFLKVSTSTIDNHKARLMKKLNIHKVPKLTRLAIREGLISA